MSVGCHAEKDLIGYLNKLYLDDLGVYLPGWPGNWRLSKPSQQTQPNLLAEEHKSHREEHSDRL